MGATQLLQWRIHARFFLKRGTEKFFRPNKSGVQKSLDDKGGGRLRSPALDKPLF